MLTRGVSRGPPVSHRFYTRPMLPRRPEDHHRPPPSRFPDAATGGRLRPGQPRPVLVLSLAFFGVVDEDGCGWSQGNHEPDQQHQSEQDRSRGQRFGRWVRKRCDPRFQISRQPLSRVPDTSE